MPDVADDVVIPVIGECDDSWLSDPSVMAVQPHHVAEALAAATDGLFAAGAIGAGSGMTCLGWKGGIGTASRVVDGHVLGALVMTNFGSLERLCVDGSPVGRRFAELGRNGEREAPEGSCIVVIATDAPILPAQCERVARRAGLGLARTGSVASHGSGEIFLAFSTTCRLERNGRGRVTHDVLSDGDLDCAVRGRGRCNGGSGARQHVPGDDDDRSAWSCRRGVADRRDVEVDVILSMPVVVAPDHVHHDVATGVWCGVTEASDELPVRAEIIATACAAAGAPIVEAEDHGLDALLRVHDPRFLVGAADRVPTLGRRRPSRIARHSVCHAVLLPAGGRHARRRPPSRCGDDSSRDRLLRDGHHDVHR